MIRPALVVLALSSVVMAFFDVVKPSGEASGDKSSVTIQDKLDSNSCICNLKNSICDDKCCCDKDCDANLRNKWQKDNSCEGEVFTSSTEALMCDQASIFKPLYTAITGGQNYSRPCLTTKPCLSVQFSVSNTTTSTEFTQYTILHRLAVLARDSSLK